MLLDQQKALSKSAMKKKLRKEQKAKRKAKRAEELRKKRELDMKHKIEKQNKKSNKSYKVPHNISKNPEYLERKHVQDVYDSIAEHWDRTRYKPWPKVTEFILNLIPGSLIADVGCGNGKNIPDCEKIGRSISCDFSEGLLKICANRGYEVLAANALELPYRSESFDAAICIAVLHHISTKARREKLVSEVVRILRLDGVALFYAWAQEQEDGASGHRFATQDVIVPFRVKKHTSTCTTFERYCHVYTKSDLLGLFDPILSVVKIEKIYFDCGNWCVIVRKKKKKEETMQCDSSFQMMKSSKAIIGIATLATVASTLLFLYLRRRLKVRRILKY